MINAQIKAYIDALPNEQLYLYATDTAGDYSEEATLYAKDVLGRRKLDSVQLASLAQSKVDHARNQIVQQERAATEPLPRGRKTLFFILGMFGFPLIVLLLSYVRYAERGEHRKFSDTLTSMTLGFGFMVMFALVLAYVLNATAPRFRD